MSWNYLYLVPKDPTWQPDPDAAARTLALFESMAKYAGNIETRIFEKIEMFDPGANWSGAICPSCGTDIENWLFGCLDEFTFTEDPACLRLMTPCCEAATSLDKLEYPAPCAFGRFAIVGENPGFVPDTAQMLAFEQSLGSPLHQVWQRV